MPWINAEMLIETYGSQAYHTAVSMMTEMVLMTPDDNEAIEDIRAAAIELMRMGYHKRGVRPEPGDYERQT
jgi:hypothetical protein